jgi:hypothetical protein
MGRDKYAWDCNRQVRVHVVHYQFVDTRARNSAPLRIHMHIRPPCRKLFLSSTNSPTDVVAYNNIHLGMLQRGTTSRNTNIKGTMI